MKEERMDIERLFKTHYRKMYRVAKCILYDEAESKDVVSDVFERILKDGIMLLPESEEGYLMRSVRNGCMNVIAHKGVRERVTNLWLAEAGALEAESSDGRLDAVMQLIEGLEPPLRRKILKLRFLKEMSYQEVADAVGVSKVTVYNHLSQAMEILRNHFEKTQSNDEKDY